MKRKKRYIIILTIILIILNSMSGCSPSYDEIAWESLNSEQSTELGTEDAGVSNTVTIESIEDALLHISAGIVKEDPDVDIDLRYDGGTMNIPFSIFHDVGEAPNFGLLLFLDGYLQPYTIEELDTEEAYLHTIDVEEGESKEFTLSFTPVTGAKGDVLELSTLVISKPDYQPDPESPVIYFMANSYIPCSCVYPVTFQADIPSDEKETFPDSCNSYCFNAEEAYVTEEVLAEYWGEVGNYITMEEYEAMYWYEVQVYIDGVPLPQIVNEYNQMVDISGKDTIHITCHIIGPAGMRLQTAFFLDGTPIALSDPSILTYATDAKKGKMDVLEFDLDTSELEEASSFYVVTAPRNSSGYISVQDPILLYRQ